MKIFFILLILSFNNCFAQRIEVQWTDSFKKEIQITCSPEEELCEKICSATSACYIDEGICLNCIGTGLQIHHIFSEIGRSIHRDKKISSSEIANLLITGDFVTFNSRDVYNLIDAHQSLAVLKKFEAFCPENSINQILFFRSHHQTRKLLSPEFLYCEFEDRAEFFKVEDKILIEKGRVVRFKHELFY